MKSGGGAARRRSASGSRPSGGSTSGIARRPAGGSPRDGVGAERQAEQLAALLQPAADACVSERPARSTVAPTRTGPTSGGRRKCMVAERARPGRVGDGQVERAQHQRHHVAAQRPAGRRPAVGDRAVPGAVAGRRERGVLVEARHRARHDIRALGSAVERRRLAPAPAWDRGVLEDVGAGLRVVEREPRAPLERRRRNAERKSGSSGSPASSAARLISDAKRKRCSGVISSSRCLATICARSHRARRCNGSARRRPRTTKRRRGRGAPRRHCRRRAAPGAHRPRPGRRTR